MKEYRYSLEKYKGRSSRYKCPDCKKGNVFALYIDNETEKALHSSVGRCNREDQCGYHLKPAEYFEMNGIEQDEDWESQTKPEKEPEPAIRIDSKVMQKSLTGYENNNFVKYLISLFNEQTAAKLISKYFIGSSRHWNNAGATVFWQIDAEGAIRTGKVMLYNPIEGRRVKHPEISYMNWVHSLTKIPGRLEQCFFGQHLLRDKSKSVAVVESEKTAIIASVYFPEFIWLACGGLSMLSYERCKALKGRNVVLFPDLNGFDKWKEKADLFLPKICTSYSISSLLEKVATLEEKDNGLDLADYLVRYSLDDFERTEAPHESEAIEADSVGVSLKQSLTEALNELAARLPKDFPAQIDGAEYPCLKTVVEMVREGWETNPGSKYFQERIREIFELVKTSQNPTL